MAIKEWSKLIDTQEITLENALVAFDMFVLHDRTGDFDEVRRKPISKMEATNRTECNTPRHNCTSHRVSKPRL